MVVRLPPNTAEERNFINDLSQNLLSLMFPAVPWTKSVPLNLFMPGLLSSLQSFEKFLQGKKTLRAAKVLNSREESWSD